MERRRLTLTRLLDPERFEQRLLIRSSKGTLPEQFRAAGIPIAEIGDGSLFSPRLLGRAIRVARQFRPHIVHGAVFEGVGVGLVAGRSCGARVIVEETSHATNRSQLGHALFRSIAGLADRCVAISPAVGDYLVEVTGVPRQRIEVISNGVLEPAPPTASKAELRRQFGLSLDAFVVGTVCRLNDDSHKRVSDLIRALALLNHDNVELLVVGEGQERPRLAALAEEVGVADRVKLVGYRDDVGNAYAAMDVFALVSAREGFGLVVAEAMLAGLPVIATGVGGIRDIVEDGRTGILIEPQKPPAIASAVRALSPDVELRARLAAAGRERARQRFGAERYAKDVEQLYLRLLKR